MTGLVRGRTNVALALSIPIVGLAYLIVDVAAGPNGTSPRLWLAVAGAWLIAAMATVVQRTEPLTATSVAVPVPFATGSSHHRRRSVPGTVNVDRITPEWRWTSLLLAPLEAVAVAWSVGVVVAVIVLLAAAVGAAALWLAQRFS